MYQNVIGILTLKNGAMPTAWKEETMPGLCIEREELYQGFLEIAILMQYKVLF